MRARLALASLLVALSSVAVPARAAAAPDLSGSWQLTFTPATVRAVGKPIPREGGLACEGSCQAGYQFDKPGAGDGRTTTLLLRLDSSGCAAAPCDVRSLPLQTGTGFTGTLHYDGTAYAGTGNGFYGGGECRRFMPADSDRIRFTVDESVSPPRLSGELTVLLAYRGPTAGEQCAGVDGYELYTGSFTATTTRAARPGGASGPSPDEVSRTALGRRAARHAADRVDATRHARPSLSTGVASARDVPSAPSHLLVSALLALLLVVLMPFPAALFNGTLEANYDEVRGWLRIRPRAGADAPDQAAREVPRWRRWRDFALLVGAAGLLDAFLDPGLGLDTASVVLVVGLALSFATVTLLASMPGRVYARRHGSESRLALYPIGLGIAAFCVLVSRLTSFQPGYLYGVVAGFSVARELDRRENGMLSAASAAFLLAVAGAAFVLRVPVHDAVTDGGGVALGLLDTVLAAVFAAGVEANVLGMLPVRFLPGERLFAWNRLVWGAAFGLSVFAFVHALASGGEGASVGASVAVAAALFGVFAAVSVAFWAYFRFRKTPPGAVVP